MSLSTAEVGHDGRVLILSFRRGRRKLAEIRVAPRADFESVAPLIRETGDPEDPDVDTPILIYSNGWSPERKVLLLEETGYELELVPEEGVEVGGLFEDLRSNSGDMALRPYTLGGPYTFTLRFSSYVGRGVFDAVLDGCAEEAPFEVRSRKLGYYDQYPRMLSDIADFSVSLLMKVKAPLYSHYEVSDSQSESGYEDFLLLEHVFTRLDLPGSYDAVKRSRHYEPVNGVEAVPAGVACSVDVSCLDDIAAGDVEPMAGGPIGGAYAPSVVRETASYDSYDTPENRMVKEVLLTVAAMAGRLLDRPGACSDYVRGRLEQIYTEACAMASDEWLSDVGAIAEVPYGSQVLARRHGYMEMFSAYQLLGLGAYFSQEDAEDLLKGRGNKVHRVYEYWCYTRLFECLARRSLAKPEFPLDVGGGAWTGSLRGREPVGFAIPCGDDVLDVDLYYNRTFRNGAEDLSSYSIDLRPDFSLVVRPRYGGGGTFLVNFDAKYKAKPKEADETQFDDARLERGCWEYDIYKMHTYRDALLHSYGSYVLFPGTRGEVYPRYFESHGDFLPSVGSICLVPGEGTSELEEALRRIFTDIATFRFGETELN